MTRGILVFLAALCAACGSGPDNHIEQLSRPFDYQGYSSADYQGFSKQSTYVSVSDGTRIALDYYLPTDYVGYGKPATAFPSIFVLTPYMRSYLRPADDGKTHEVLWTSSDRPGVGSNAFIRHGYALVVADTRGHGASSDEGGFGFGFRYQQDAGELVEWIAEQPWSDKNVGMIGGSHVGWTQLAAAGQKPAALKAITPAVVPMEGFTGQFFQGGIFMQGFLTGNYNSDAIAAIKAERAKNIPAPVIDEDGDGELADEIPLDLNNSGSFIDDYAPGTDRWPPRYSDNADRQHVYFFAFYDRKSQPGIDWGAEPYIDARAPSGENGKDLLANMLDDIAETDIAIYNIGGWFDGFARGTTELYATLAPHNPSRLIMFPGYHNLVKGFMYDDFGASPGDLLVERLRFFDRYLKGIDNGIDREAPVLIYNMMGDGWRQEQEWPLARAEARVYHLANNQLTAAAPANKGTSAYRVQLGHDRRYGDNLSDRWFGLNAIAPDSAPDMTKQDKNSLLFDSSPLTEDVEVTGHPVVRLQVSSTAKDGDFYVYLQDVDPSGRSLMVTEGQLRAGWADLQDPNTMTDTGIDILPKLPWHGYQKSQYRENILADSKVIELVIDFHPTSWTFRAGHTIRLAVTGANWPNFALHPALSPTNNPDSTDNIEPTIFVHSGPVGSTLELPIIPE